MTSIKFEESEKDTTQHKLDFVPIKLEFDGEAPVDDYFRYRSHQVPNSTKMVNYLFGREIIGKQATIKNDKKC